MLESVLMYSFKSAGASVLKHDDRALEDTLTWASHLLVGSSLESMQTSHGTYWFCPGKVLSLSAFSVMSMTHIDVCSNLHGDASSKQLGSVALPKTNGFSVILISLPKASYSCFSVVAPNCSQPGHLLPKNNVKVTVACTGAKSKATIATVRIMI